MDEAKSGKVLVLAIRLEDATLNAFILPRESR